MNTTCLSYRKCPHCGKELEIQLKPSDYKIKLARLEESLSGENTLVWFSHWDYLAKKGIVRKFKAIREKVMKQAKTKKGISSKEMTQIIKKNGILEEEPTKICMKILKEHSELYINEKGNYFIL